MDVHLVADVVLFISIFIVGLLIKTYLPGYIGEKAKNLATKEDIAGITDKIEQVKADYAKQLELYKSDIWQSQQRYLKMQEVEKLKVETFKKAVVDVAKLTDLISTYQLHASDSEMKAAIAQMAFDKDNHEVYEASWGMHLEQKEKAAALYSSFRELIVELGGTFALFSIYFEHALTESLERIIIMSHGAVELKMTPAEFHARLENECSNGLDLNIARENVGRYYDTLYDVNFITEESNRFFQLMKNHIKLAG
ncbi:hypothetical protein RS3R6_38650 [Pseudomonas atacamensis]|uniref:Uncharacterized protein n=1 Tax=Pseudomonas atacamensis TaxID=2565368 RepID=A0ABQ5PP21_9PSED|nr:hypothetical protein [Pseudomonas atacamensis]GLH45196.1 hypothetical protein RS3R1_42840 [Pseudomonas atacamensis]GLH55683.1 hypothetical protein RS3R6_38650 [Pseudomonas atacamensis]